MPLLKTVPRTLPRLFSFVSSTNPGIIGNDKKEKEKKEKLGSLMCNEEILI